MSHNWRFSASAPFAFLAVAMLASESGCSVLADANRTQCSTDADCVARGAAFTGSVCQDSFCQAPPEWACLDAPDPVAATGVDYSVSFLVTDTVSQEPQGGLTIRACLKRDVTCADGLGAAVTTDASGKASLRVPPNFDGYVRIEGSSVLPTLYFFNPPVTQNLSDVAIAISSPQTAAALAALTGVKPDFSLGIVLLSVFDCTGAPAAGITLSSGTQSSQTSPFYIRNGLPTSTVTTTDSTGYGGIVNASLGTVSFLATRAEDGRQIGAVTVLVQSGWETISQIVPNGG